MDRPTDYGVANTSYLSSLLKNLADDFKSRYLEKRIGNREK